MLSILLFTGIAKIYFEYETSLSDSINFSIGIKIILTLAFALRIITLFVLELKFSRSIWYFVLKKVEIKRKNDENALKFSNYLVISLLCMILALRIS